MTLSIQDLKQSNNFLNIILENITSAIFLVDNNMTIYEFNKSFQVLFHKKEDKILHEPCGNVLGCQYAVEESALCGTTSNCTKCLLRKCILQALNDQINTFKQYFERTFYIENEIIKKHFQFTTKYVNYKNKDMVLIILDDVTEIQNSKNELKKRANIIEKYNTKIKKDLQLAKKVQKNMIPEKLPQISGIKLHGLYSPLEEVGGDIYDVIKIDKSRVGLFIGDISGHGLSAAMITSMVNALMETSKKLLSNPAKLVQYLNNKLLNITDDMYLTAFYGVYNTQTRKLKYSRCGHPYPILIRNGRCLKLDTEGNLILGMFKDANFTTEIISLENGDKLILYTDGLTEVKNLENLQFKDKLYNYLLENHALSIDALIDSTYKEVKNFAKEKIFMDDVCILGMEITE